MNTPLQWKIETIFWGGLRPGKTIITLIYFVLLFLYTFMVQAQTPIFPGAEGYGQYTKGGRGGTIIKVTNLNASGPGSFTDAILASGPRIVVFEVSGTIDIGNQVAIKNPYLTIAGQSAPSPGITIRGGAIAVKTHNVLIQHIRVRLGYTDSGDDCIKITSAGTGDLHDIYLDHVTMSWGKDENLSIYQRDGRISNVSISHCFITEAMGKNGTHTGAKGFLVAKDPYNAVSETIGDFSVTKTLFAHNNQRNPNMKNGSQALLTNNVVYGYRHSAVEIGDNNGEFKVCNVNNVYKTRPGIVPLRPPVNLRDPYNGQLYLSGNEIDGQVPSQMQLMTENMTLMSTSPMDMSVTSVLPTSETFDYVLEHAGARPADRDAVDSRVVGEVRAGTGKWMDQTEANSSYPFLAMNTRAFNVANPNGDDDGDGYTNVEEELYKMKLEVEGLSDGPEPTPDPNLAPTISSISNQSIDENSDLGPINFTVGDDQTNPANLIVSAVSSNQSIVMDGGISLGGSGTNRTIMVSPIADQFGTVDITITVSDGELTSDESFTLTINEKDDTPPPPVNTAPTISNIGDIEIDQDQSSGAITFQVNDAETMASQLSVTASSGNMAVISNGGLSIAGAGSSKTITITPMAGQSGKSDITISVSDGDMQASTSFVVTVIAKDEEPEPPVNTAPVITGLSDLETDQDEMAGPANFQVNDAESAPSDLKVSATSNNQSLISNAGITISGTGATRSISVMPMAGQFGNATVKVTVSDGEMESSSSIAVVVNEIADTPEEPTNTAPMIAPIDNQVSAANQIVGPIYLDISDKETPTSQLQLTVGSSSQGIISNKNMKIKFGGGGVVALFIRPSHNKTGNVEVTIGASDGEFTTTESFQLSINAGFSSPGEPTKEVISNAPNPFSTSTTLTYNIEETTSVGLTIYDMNGNTLRSLVNETQSPGEYKVQWDRKTDRGETVQDGMYIYRFEAENQVIMNRIIIGH